MTFWLPMLASMLTGLGLAVAGISVLHSAHECVIVVVAVLIASLAARGLLAVIGVQE